MPIARIHGGRQSYLYSLGPAGVPIVAECLGQSTQPVRRRRLDRLDDLFVDHDLKAAAFWANLKAVTRRTGPSTTYEQVTDVVWTSERELRAKCLHVQDPKTKRYLPVLPDGSFVVHYGDSSIQYALVEIDMGTMPLQRFRQKMRAFSLHLDEVWRRKPEWYYQVYVLASSYNRREELREASRAVIQGSDQSLFMFGTMLMLQPQAFGRPGWVDLDGEEVTLIFPPADQDEHDEEAAHDEAR